MIDSKNIKIEDLNAFMDNSMSGFLEMEVTALGEDFLEMRMPVQSKTHQPFGILNGGASMALAESAASLAGNLIVGPENVCVGLEINGNHLRSERSGYVTARATPIHLGKKTHVWNIEIRNENGDMVNISRMTLAVLPKTSV